jgi:hypothetical protein
MQEASSLWRQVIVEKYGILSGGWPEGPMGYALGRILGMVVSSSPTLSHSGLGMALVFHFGMMSGAAKLFSNLHSQNCT